MQTEKKTYRLDKETLDDIAKVAEEKKITATEVIRLSVRSYAQGMAGMANDQDKQPDNSRTPDKAYEILADQLAAKDAQIEQLTKALSDSLERAQAIQVSNALAVQVKEPGFWARIRAKFKGEE